MTDAIVLSNVSKSYLDFSLSDISFSLPKGYIMGFIGPNGAGKTTTIKLILNMIKRSGGRINVFGLDNQKDETEIKLHTGVVFDSHYFFEEWTVKEVGQVMALFFSNWQPALFERQVQQHQLPLNKKVSQLSKGMQLKLMLACALSHDARLLILDEPTSGLDPVAREELLELLTNFIQDGERSVLFSTHITSDLERIADFITFIHEGRLIYTGTKDDFVSAFRLVKGGLEDLSPEVKRDLISFRTHSSGFEGLIHAEKIGLYPNLFAEDATIDNIIVYTYKGSKTHESNH